MSLAGDLPHQTLPRLVREMRVGLAHLPALWAKDGDWVLAEDRGLAEEGMRSLGGAAARVRLVTPDELHRLPADAEIAPWGWDRSLTTLLRASGVADRLLPSEATLARIRAMSHRRWAATHLLTSLTGGHPHRVGRAEYAESVEECRQHRLPCVIKAPWSSSGRGVRLIGQWTERDEGWVRGVIRRQGGVTIEPYYKKILDFGIEMEATAQGVAYCGLSLFATSHGAYTGNMVATEGEKMDILARHIDISEIERAAAEITSLLTHSLGGEYRGPLGVDMMLADADGETRLHPMVELNLRRTMGHAALAVRHADCLRLERDTASGAWRVRLH